MNIQYIKSIISSFFSNPKKLFWFYIFLNMLPSIFLVFTEPLNWGGKVILILFPLGLYFCLLSMLKNTGMMQIILFPLSFIHAFQIVLLYLFGEAVIAVDMFLNVVTTSASEAGEVLDSLMPSVIFVCVLYIPETIIAIRQWRNKKYLKWSYRKKYLGIGILFLVISYSISFFSANINTGDYAFRRDAYPYNAFYNLDFAINKWKKVCKYPETSKNFAFGATRDTLAPDREIYIMVIGETSRAENWGMYGYERNTTPNLEKEDGLVYFPDAITQSNATHKSVSIMLSQASAENYDVVYDQKSILSAFKEVGFTTVFLSNQGINRSFTEYFAKEADININIRSLGDMGIQSVNNYDEALIPIFEHCVDSVPGNMFVVIHTYGSHFNYKERYPETFSVYTPDNVTGIRRADKDKLVNAYDNTILYTDYFLSRLITSVKDRNLCSSLVFASDHGEDILDDNRMRFLHASPNPTFYQLKIPMFIWFSDLYRKDFYSKYNAALLNREKPVSTNAVFHTLLDIASIHTSYKDDDLSLVDTQFKIAKRMYLNDHDEPVFYYNANLKKQDKAMIEKRKMHH